MIEVVILPGLDGTAKLLDGFCSRLARRGIRARALAYPPNRPIGYAGLEPLVRVQLPAHAPFVLLGESFSGPLAIRIAATPPANLVGLVLSTTFARAPVPALTPLAGLVRFAPGRPPMRLLSWWLLGDRADPALLSTLRTALHAVAPATLRARAAAALRVDVVAQLGQIGVPALNLVGSRDRLLARSAGKLLAERLPDCRTLAIDGPHLLLQAATAPCAQAVADFALGLADDAGRPPRSPHPPA